MNSISTSIIGLSAFLHDIGKFAERGEYPLDNYDNETNKQIFLPFNESQKRYTHKHSLYTAKVIESLLSKILPDWYLNSLSFLKENSRIKVDSEDNYIHLSAKHHHPETTLQKLIAIADRIASSLDRQEFTDYNKEINIRDYKNTRLLSIFESVSLTNQNQKKSYDDYRYVYEVNKFGVEEYNSFPSIKDNLKQSYKQLWDEFQKEISQLQFPQDPFLFIERLLTIAEIYLSFIPATTVGKTIPDISLFDHSKIVSAIAIALFQYYNEIENKDKINEIESLNYDQIQGEPFLIIQTNFFGIQKFIFEETDTQKNAAKIIRARSLMIQILQELISYWIIKELELNPFSILMNAAGKVQILAGNIERNKVKIKEIQKKINDWFLKYYFGEAGTGINVITASSLDFLKPENLINRLRELSKEEDKYKFKKWGFITYQSLNYDTSKELCDYCRKRPCSKKNDEYNVCEICEFQIQLGSEIFKTKFLVFEEKQKGLFFDHFDISISNEGFNHKKVIKLYTSDYQEFQKESMSSYKINYKGYIPLDNHQKTLSFDDISRKGINEEQNELYGVPYLGVLKADVDNLGTIFQKGIPNANISRIVSLSRLLNNFFSNYVAKLLKNEFQDIYMVFSGGDDLFLIGPYNQIIDLSYRIYKDFKDYTCNNPDISLSMGISFHKKNDPILFIAESSEEMLYKAKKTKNSICLFNENILWNNWDDLKKVEEKVYNNYKNNLFSRSFLYKILEFIEDYSIAKTKNNFKIEERELLLWKAKLYYTIKRNLEPKMKVEGIRKEITYLEQSIKNYQSKLKIPIYLILYKTRKQKKELL